MTAPVASSGVIQFFKNVFGSDRTNAVMHVSKDQELAVSSACNKLAFQLLQSLSKTNTTTLISAFSLLPVMGMLLKGMSDPRSKQKVLQELGLGHMREDEIHAAISNFLLKTQCSDQNSKLTVTTSNVAFSKSSSFTTEYKAAIKNYYEASVHEGSKDLAEAINSWVREKTNGLIQDIVSESEVAECSAALANAVYYKGAWKKKFDSSETTLQRFTDATGTSKNVQMMSQDKKERYFDSRDFQLLAKRYECPEGRALSHVFVLPRRGTDIAGFEQAFTDNALQDALRHAGHEKVIFSLPRLNITSETDELQDKIPQYLLQEASYDAMAPGFVLKKIKQKATMQVNEEGSQASAITAAFIQECASSPSRTMKLDRPFMHFIIDETDGVGSILFAATVKDFSCLELG